MNSAHVVGRVLKKIPPYGGSSYKVLVRRSGKKEVFDELEVTLLNHQEIITDKVYEFKGTLGTKVQERAESRVDICVYVNKIVQLKDDATLFSKVNLSGTITSMTHNPGIPRKLSLLLNADDGSYTDYKIAAWNKRMGYVGRKSVGDHLNVCGELVKYVYHINNDTFYHTEIAFWFEDSNK